MGSWMKNLIIISFVIPSLVVYELLVESLSVRLLWILHLSECGRISVDVGFRQPAVIGMNPNPLVQSMFLCQQRKKVSCLWERDGITAS